ncbi:MAG: NAD(P)-dependent dehydrogenase (short-subunit alcohol dehydrogenase family) [Myxococcota bacterium]|jgi:NAD(P)-dependent dehydrogenase (short-subunit alcohol dehydrogenase family)
MSDDTVNRLTAATALLEAIVEDRSMLAGIDAELRERFLIAAGRVARPTGKERRKLARERRRQTKLGQREANEALLDQTGIRKLRENPIFQTPRRQRGEPQPPPIGVLHDARTCYVCQSKYTDVHFFYDHMCPACAEFNYAKRSPEAHLHGRVAIVTGARVKIGYQAAILLLRSGCHVIVLTRFPRDAARRYAAEEDADSWLDRLEIHGIDLRHTPSVEAFCARILATHERLDLIINNACQTVRRPTGFYDHMMALETGDVAALTDRERSVLAETHALAVDTEASSAELSQVKLTAEDHHAGTALFPEGQFDADLQQVDLRASNSWRLRMHEVGTVELLEVQLVNAVAPYLLNARLKPLLAAVPTHDAHIVNVSAMEGQFYRTFKSEKHPHTNMAKAALNMMTRTAALDYINAGIHMNSVDTGWVTDEDPAQHAERKRAEHRFHPPLDIVDGAARIVDPFFDGVNTGTHVWGQFLKNYKPTDW